MRTSPVVVTAFAALTLSSSACLAQTPTPMRSTCQGFGIPAQEPVGDREGHVISVAPYSCVSQGGVLDGAVASGTNYWELDKGAGLTVVGTGVIRKPGMLVLYTVTSGNYALTTADGKVTGFAGTAKGTYTTATGSAASLAGKAYTARFRSSDRGQFVIETTVDP
ncbi:hypothetical protein [Variovorax sp. OV329]|uniref:hypothetical protein n=1 Tax=Variovorax sp. OV329 TaxID=1882825 RepID=UPI0008E9FD3C|nr:hypothetical protein [Variovorax sp. OV329]SFN42006.1 hypothetical protein SAMN05444747_12554 [Variovorax sp. OV329]